jgi:hypothetical protein
MNPVYAGRTIIEIFPEKDRHTGYLRIPVPLKVSAIGVTAPAYISLQLLFA